MRFAALILGLAMFGCGNMADAQLEEVQGNAVTQSEEALMETSWGNWSPNKWIRRVHFRIITHYVKAALEDQAANKNRMFWAEALFDGIDDPEMVDEYTDFFIVDVRKASDFAAGHIPGAFNMPTAEIVTPENLPLLPMDEPILVYCNSGTTAGQVAGTLRVLGFTTYTLHHGLLSVRAETMTKIYSKTSPAQTIYGYGFELEASE